MTNHEKRNVMLTKIRRALGVAGDEQLRRQMVNQRLNKHSRNIIPKRASIPHSDQVALFEKMAIAAAATIANVKQADEVPIAVADYLEQSGLAPIIRRGSDKVIGNLPWHQKAKNLEVATGPAEINDQAAINRAFAGVAETGTLAVVSGADSPVTLNFLPETHIVMLRASDIVGCYEDVWDRLRARFGDSVMPRTLNYITGPSRTADIAQKLELGAHGPRRVHIIIVGS